MKTDIKYLQNNLRFWTALGPFALLLTLAIDLIKFPSSTWFLAPMSLIGALLCWKWKQTGLIVSIVATGLIMAIFYSGLNVDDRLWQIGMSAALCLGFVILTLGQEEVESIQGLMRFEVIDYQKRLVQVEESKKRQEENERHEKQNWDRQTIELQHEISQNTSHLLSKNKLLEIVGEELETLSSQRETLLECNLLQENEINQLKFQASESHFKLKELEESTLTFGLKEAEKVNLLNFELDLLKSQLQSSQSTLSEAKAEHVKLKLSFDELTASYLCEKTLLEKAIGVLQFEVEQRAQKEYQSTKYIESQENSLIALRESLAAKEREVLAEEDKVRTLNDVFAKSEKNLIDQIELLQGQCQSISLALESQTHKITELEKTSTEAAPVEPTPIDSTAQMIRLQKDKHLVESLYKQLREQFDEKTNTLTQARRDLFYAKEKLTVLLREREEVRKFVGDPYTQALESYLLNLSKNNEELEVENKIQEDLITKLLTHS